MFSTGGGGFDLPLGRSPVEMLIMLVVVLALCWLAYRLFSS
jgi:hypothetical protein